MNRPDSSTRRRAEVAVAASDRAAAIGQETQRPSRSVPPERPHRVLDIETDEGPARAFVVDPFAADDEADAASEPVGTLVLGHGAGKGTNTPDLHALLALADDGWRVILVDQPWVLAGRKIATPPKTLDAGWRDVIARLCVDGEIVGRFVQGGRSAGARVACRTADDLKVDAVVALAFPLMPPGKLDDPTTWRTAEAQAVVDAGIPLLVVQGERDTFGGPDAVSRAVPRADVAAVAGPHGFSKNPADVAVAVGEWLRPTPC